MGGNWFSRNGFDAWKLGTLSQYIAFALVCIAGFFIFKLVISRIRKNRTPDKATARVAKRLVRLGGHGAKTFRNVIIRTADGDCPCELLYMAKDKLHPVKVLYRGSVITGSVTDAKWRLIDQRKEVWIVNPVPALRKQANALEKLMTEQGVAEIHVEPLVVCAENLESPRVTIKGFKQAVPYQQLRLWRTKNPIVKAWRMDVGEIGRILTDSLVAQAPANVPADASESTR